MLKETLNSEEYKKCQQLMSDISTYPVERNENDLKVLVKLIELEEAVQNFKSFIKNNQYVMDNESADELAKYILESRLLCLRTAANAGPPRPGGSDTLKRMEQMEEMGRMLVETIDKTPGVVDMASVINTNDTLATNDSVREARKAKILKGMKDEGIIPNTNAPKRKPGLFGKSLGFESND